MSVATISIPLDNRIVQAYNRAPRERQERLQKLIAVMVEQFADSSPQSLFTLMDEMSDEAARKGLTEEILASILQDE
jgi:hypothetical protein